MCIDLHILDDRRNLVDAANFVSLASLLTFRILDAPQATDLSPLIVHYLPIEITFAFIADGNTLVIDPSHFKEAVMERRMIATLNANGDICFVQNDGGKCVTKSVVMLYLLIIASVKVVDIMSIIKDAFELNNSERTTIYSFSRVL
ncbi:Protein RRP45A [Forsythia ovata]|uniref:Protein RRP45A n=1 Tax=Forsythia ovata TaxID=205694 RepID=A0ABD1WQQ3_9LAMI